MCDSCQISLLSCCLHSPGRTVASSRPSSRTLKVCQGKDTAMAAYKVLSNLRILALFFLCLSIPASSDDPSFYPSKFGSFTPHGYTRFADVERHCQSVLSSAAELRVGADRVPFPMDSLSFMNGDWSQDAGQAPLLPFQGTYADAAAAATHPQRLEAVNLVSFMLTHTDTAPQRGGAGTAALNVSGILTLAITRNCCCSSMEPHERPEFVLRPGVAKLHIQFQGVYTETRSSAAVGDDGGGGAERVLCMVGNALLPVRGGNGSDPWDWAKNHGGEINPGAPPVRTDDNILLVLRYPKTRKLEARAVHGEMMSTSPRGAYFDKVRLVSSLNQYYSRYQFRQEDDELDATTGCRTHPSLHDGDVAGRLYRGSGAAFCNILRQFTPQDYGVMDVIPNWNCNSTDAEFCSPLGPFETSRRETGGTATAMAFSGAAIAVQGLECEPDGARASAVFRFVPPWEHQPTAAKRTGLGGTTLSAEGAWSASTGRLCMVACRGGVGKNACRHRVTLYVPTTFSITRRAIVVGHITAMDGSHSPISFRQLVSPRHDWRQHFDNAGETLRMAYNYSKIKQASDLVRRSQPSGFRDSFIAKSFLSYPKMPGAADDMTSLSNLGEDLGLRFRCSPKPQFVPNWIEEPFFQLQILSIGSLVGSYQSPYQQGEPSMRFEQINTRYGVEKQEVLNVSAEFEAPSRKFFDTRQVMSLEGVYRPDDGRMHLIGCRDVHAPWQVSPTSRDLEEGMDCSIEVTVEYPPTTTRWLISPVAKVYIASTRDADDPLHFNRTELRSLPIIYRDQRNELTEPKVEGFLCIAMLSATIAATVSQLRHVRSHPNVAPYVSLAMLGVQALGYSATLVMDAKTLPAWPTSRYRAYADRLQWSVDCSVKALTLVALLLTARLARKVRRSRARARARSPLEPGRVPSDGAVVVYSFVVFLGGLFFVLAVHWLNTSRTLPPGMPDVVYHEAQGSSRLMHTRSAVVERYFGVAKEWFLLPQVIGNAVWRVNCKPLAARYYAGVTAVWLLPHIYGYLRPPVVPPEAPEHSTLDFYSSKAIAMAVPVVGAVLALAVFVQQRWNYRIVGWVMKGGQNKLQHVY